MKKELSKKNKIKRAKLPLGKMHGKEKDYVAVILEEVRADFKAFGETLDFVRKKGDATFEEVGRIRVEIEEIKDTQVLIQSDVSVLKQDVSVLKQDVSVLKQDVSVLKQDVSVLKQDVSVLKQDVKQINVRLDDIEREVGLIRIDLDALKITLTQKVDIEFLKTLEARLIIVEQRLKLANS